MAKNDKTLAVITHILGIFTSFVGALIVYLVAEDKKTKEHARNALNWQLSALIYYIISFILIFILVGIVLIFVVALLNIIFSILAAVKASEGTFWKYPLTIQFIK